MAVVMKSLYSDTEVTVTEDMAEALRMSGWQNAAAPAKKAPAAKTAAPKTRTTEK